MSIFDGFHHVNSWPALNFTVIGAIPTRGVFQTDGWGWLHTGFVYTSLTGQVRAKEKNPCEWRLFGIYYNDRRHVLKTDNRSAAQRQLDMGNIRLGTFGGHYLQAFDTGAATIDLMTWDAVQAGSWGAPRDRAGVFAGEAGYSPTC